MHREVFRFHILIFLRYLFISVDFDFTLDKTMSQSTCICIAFPMAGMEFMKLDNTLDPIIH